MLERIELWRPPPRQRGRGADAVRFVATAALPVIAALAGASLADLVAPGLAWIATAGRAALVSILLLLVAPGG
jgi:hypothetical protein